MIPERETQSASLRVRIRPTLKAQVERDALRRHVAVDRWVEEVVELYFVRPPDDAPGGGALGRCLSAHVRR